MKYLLRAFRAVTAAALAAVLGAVAYYDSSLPDNYLVTEGSRLVLGDHIEVRADPLLPENYVIDVTGYCSASTGGKLLTERTEKLRLFGIFPIKDVNVREVSEPVVVPCGTPFGIKMITEGVMVVDLTGFDTGGEVISPAKEAGIREGDVIVSISGKAVSSNADVSSIIEESGGRTLGVELIHEGKSKVVFIKPCRSSADGAFRAGMWVRDSSAGIGTVTFYLPETGVFAGLGHPVCDVDTGEMLTMAEGEAANVVISSLKKSSAGSPGELVGMFSSDKPAGSLLMNTESGLYGKMDCCPVSCSAVPVAMRQEVKTGAAEIIATVSGSAAKHYSVEIERISIEGGSSNHDMVIRVTDDELLENAGGIVQGMSGSPIIQDGKLVGAVTHVLVRDPSRGYAIFADTMLEAANNVNCG